MSTVKRRFVLASFHTWILRAAYADGGVGQGLPSRSGPGQFGPIVTTPESRPCSAADPDPGSRNYAVEDGEVHGLGVSPTR